LARMKSDEETISLMTAAVASSALTNSPASFMRNAAGDLRPAAACASSCAAICPASQLSSHSGCPLA